MYSYRFSHKNQSHFTCQSQRERISKEFGEPAHVLGEVGGVLTGTAHTVGGAAHWACVVHWA